MVCVDDGSVDGTLDTLQSLKRRFSRVRVVRHERSRGQSAAIVSGVRTARGEWVVTLDGHGQNDPGDIPALLLSVERACPTPSLVVGWRKNRRDPWVKRMSSKLANIAYRWLIGDVTPEDVSRGPWKKNGALHSVIGVSYQAATSACSRTSLRRW